MSPPSNAVGSETVTALTNEGIMANVAANAPSLLNGSSGPSSSNPVDAGELSASKLSYAYTTTPQTPPVPNSAEVWQQGAATDHMVLARYDAAAGGWQAPTLQPYGPISLMPSASALHYATECFEGMKLYRGFDGGLRLFRPDRNAARMLASAARVSLPAFPPAELVRLIAALAAVDAPKWLPKDRAGSFLYVRPTFISTTPSVAVKRPTEALLYVFFVHFPPFDEPGGTLGPPGSAAAGGAKEKKNKGVRLFASEDDTIRAWPGGFGNAKLGANYGPSLNASFAAAQKGYDQILWLFGPEGWVTEAGASNFFAVMKDKTTGQATLITAPLDDQIILPGITRMSVMEAAKELLADELVVEERRFSIHELIEAVESGRMIECFASGTAFFISAIGEIHYRGRDIEIPLGADGVMGDFAKRIRAHLRSIMYGEIDHPWGYKITETGVKAS